MVKYELFSPVYLRGVTFWPLCENYSYAVWLCLDLSCDFGLISSLPSSGHEATDVTVQCCLPDPTYPPPAAPHYSSLDV